MMEKKNFIFSYNEGVGRGDRARVYIDMGGGKILGPGPEDHSALEKSGEIREEAISLKRKQQPRGSGVSFVNSSACTDHLENPRVTSGRREGGV